MRAIILAGGLGTRLAKVVPELPKPMAPVAGKPFLEHLLHVLSASDFDEVILSVGYLGHFIVRHFGEQYRSTKLQYCNEAVPLGTGGALVLALSTLEPADDSPVFVMNGDTFAEIDYCAMLDYHSRAESDITIALVEVPDASRYGKVRLEGPRIVGFLASGVAGPGLINSGTYLLRRSLFADLTKRFGSLPERFSFESHILTKYCSELSIIAFPGAGYFIDIGVPEDYERVQSELPRRTARA